MEETREAVTKNVTKGDAVDILDRIIGFINSCDNKAAIVLGILGVVFAVILTSDGVVMIHGLILKAEQSSGRGTLFLILMALFFLALCFGIYQLISVLIGRTNTAKLKKDRQQVDSVIFFKDIAKKYSYEGYNQKMKTLTQKALLDDILSEIYVNAVICDIKFRKYNRGLRFSLTGLLCFVLMLIVGYFLF